MKIILPVLLAISLSGCFTSSNVTIRIENLAFVKIDSAVVHVNNYKCVLYNIPWGITVKKEIFRDSIHFNTHDITVHALVYGSLLPAEGEAGYYYTDLGGSPAKFYTITFTHERKVKVSATY